MINVLFLSRSVSESRSAYDHRIRMLARCLREKGCTADILFLGDLKRTAHTMIPLYVPYVARACRPYDLIYAGASPCAYVAILSKPFHRKKIIHDFHGDRLAETRDEIRQGSVPWFKALPALVKVFVQECVSTYGADHCLAVSKPLRRLLQNRGIPEQTISLIRNGVDLQRFGAAPRKDPASAGRLFTYAGKFQIYQAVDDFLEAVRQIQNPGIRFRIVGFGPGDAGKKREIRERVGQRVELVDEVPQERLVGLLRESDVLVIPRRTSKTTTVAFPTKFAEYIALAKPVLVSNVDETAVLTEKSGCGTVYREGPVDLRRKIEALAALPPDRLETMGRRGRRLAEAEFGWNVIGAGFARLVRAMVPRGAAARLTAAYRAAMVLSDEFPLREEMVIRHWALEKELARRILQSSKSERSSVVREAYVTLYKRLPWLIASRVHVRQPVEEKEYAILAAIGSAPKHILEVGSGNGSLIHYLATQGHRCRGTDIVYQSELVRRTHEKNLALEFRQYDGIHVEEHEPEARLDICFSNNVIEHFHPDDTEDHFGNIRKVLKKGGSYILKTPHRLYGPHGLEKIYGIKEPQGLHLKEYTYRDIRAFARRSGYADARAVFILPERLRMRFRRLFGNRVRQSRAYLDYLCAFEWGIEHIPGNWLRRTVLQAVRFLFFPRQVFMVLTK